MRANTPAPHDVLLFEIAGRLYGLPAEQVREVLPAATLTPLPDAPAVVEGVLDVRGEIVPVLDIRARFRLPPRAIAYSDHLVVARAGARTVAIRVDQAHELRALERDAISDVADPDGGLPGVRYVAGVARLPDGLLVLHDLATFLSADEHVALDALLREPDTL